MIGDYLRYLKDFALSKLTTQWGPKGVTAQNVLWALTVPAGWSETAKKTMRHAAVIAGLVTQAGSRYDILSL